MAGISEGPHDDRLAVESYAELHFRRSSSFYATFAGLVEGVLEDDMPDVERVQEMRLALAALDLTLAEGDGDGPYLIVPHGPVEPPYGAS